MGMVGDETVIERCDLTRITGIKAAVLMYIKCTIPLKKGAIVRQLKRIRTKNKTRQEGFQIKLNKL